VEIGVLYQGVYVGMRMECTSGVKRSDKKKKTIDYYERTLSVNPGIERRLVRIEIDVDRSAIVDSVQQLIAEYFGTGVRR